MSSAPFLVISVKRQYAPPFWTIKKQVTYYPYITCKNRSPACLEGRTKIQNQAVFSGGAFIRVYIANTYFYYSYWPFYKCMHKYCALVIKEPTYKIELLTQSIMAVKPPIGSWPGCPYGLNPKWVVRENIRVIPCMKRISHPAWKDIQTLSIV